MAKTLKDTLDEVAVQFAAAGLDEARGEARRVVAAALGCDAVALVVGSERLLSDDDVARIAQYMRRRADHEPLSRIEQRRAFYGRFISLSAETLDPRPDTETLVEEALAVAGGAEGRDDRKPLRILDIGTGSGAILVTLLAELPDAVGLGVDISADALATAQDNASRHGVAGRARFEQNDIRQGLDGAFDLIVSNPPYIATGDIDTLEPEVRRFDPVAALDGGRDGLDFYRILARFTVNLTRGGSMLVEVGAGQSAAVAELFAEASPGAIIRTTNDLAGHTRVVSVKPQIRQHCE